MYVLYDYRYVIACSRLPHEFRREFRRLARGRVTSTYDWRTRAKDPVPAETQCRRVAEVLAGFEALRASGYALQTPWNFSTKHLRVLINRWSTQRLTSEEAAERLEHWRQFLRRIRKHQLIALLSAPLTVGASGVGSKNLQCSHMAAYSRPDIPVLTSDKAMEALTEHRGDLRKAARALGTTTHSVCEALNEGRSRESLFPTGLPIVT
ncbi:hypothetical protein [Paraburkholderia terricola]|uniref:Uncharacterized protein n=1 Tax=Paraburkholderia terricola TaxID=169427 RepID=A0A1M6VSI2_9BURK|nr:MULTISPECIES: hypothetical protein [Paraburkholderia]SDP09132.1 hypothetical protein SAMN05192547_10412 [Paraburkholderia sediminicola]SHK84196.1 hypothetical protein SAMN05192548_10412 [Paraburkholderia terricola]